jgi:hypothetical protein
MELTQDFGELIVLIETECNGVRAAVFILQTNLAEEKEVKIDVEILVQKLRVLSVLLARVIPTQ